MKHERGSILVGVLWCLVLLALVVIGILHSARMDLLVARSFADQIQARYLAQSGIEKAKALLFQDARERQRSRQNHHGSLENAPDHFRAVALGRGVFDVFRPGHRNESDRVVYGVTDEEARLNLNQVPPEDLARIEGMPPDVIAAIADWRDGDNQVTPGGAEIDYYASLQPPRRPRNGSFLSVGELGMVRGVSSADLSGLGLDGEGVSESSAGLDDESPDEDDEAPWVEPERGWAALFTVHSAVRNVSASGEARVHAQNADESALTRIPGITSDIARGIIAYRGQRKLENLLDLLDVRAVQPAESPMGPGAPNVGQPPTAGQPGPMESLGPPGVVSEAVAGPVMEVVGNPASPPPGENRGGTPSGPPLISEELFLEIADEVTVDDQPSLAGAINVNTASEEVLACLPGVSRELARAVVAQRESGGSFPHAASLLRVPGMSREVLRGIVGRLSARSETFRIRAEGRVASTRVRQRVESIVRVTGASVETLAYREEIP